MSDPDRLRELLSSPNLELTVAGLLTENETLKARIAKLEAAQSVCVCFITKPCPDCVGRGNRYQQGYKSIECTSCKGSGRKRDPKCAECEAAGKP
jgi:hypothetical protein